MSARRLRVMYRAFRGRLVALHLGDVTIFTRLTPAVTTSQIWRLLRVGRVGAVNEGTSAGSHGLARDRGIPAERLGERRREKRISVDARRDVNSLRDTHE